MDRTQRQTLGIEKWIKNGCRGTALYVTGFGKTRTALTALQRFLSKNPLATALIVVPTDYLKDQWVTQIAQMNLLKSADVQIINTVVKKDHDVDLLILDEIHAMASDTFYKVFSKVKYKLILGLTGTITRLDGKEELILKHCPVFDEVGMDEAIKNGWLSPYTEYKVLIEPDDFNEYQEYHSTFMKAFSVFNFDFSKAMACVGGEKINNRVVKKPYQVQYDFAKSLCMLPNNSPGYSAKVKEIFNDVKLATYAWNNALKKRKEYVMKHPKKIEITKRILETRADKKAITFSATIDIAEKIGIGYVLHSGKTKKKRGIIKEEFDQLTTGVLNTSKAIDVGADIPGVNLGVILCNQSSNIQKRQRLGRIIRHSPGKHAEIFTLVIKGTMEEGWFTKSSAGTKYTEITEDQLYEILDNKQITQKDELEL